MASIIKNQFSVALASNFIDAYGLGSTTNLLYMAIGRDAAWSDENNPPAPADKDGSAGNDTAGQNEFGFEADVHAMKSIPLANIQPIVPRRDWAIGIEYNPVQTDSADPRGATDYYVVNTSSQVWICTKGNLDADGAKAAGTSATSASGDTPFKASPTAADTFIGSTDLYEWEYLYTIPGISANAFTAAWMPVNYGVTVTGNDNADSNIRLGSDHIMFIGEFDNTVTIDGGLTDDQYRQIGIYLNPELSGGGAATAAVYNDPQTEIFNALNNRGKLIYIENRTQIQRSASQIEHLKVVVEF